MYVCMYDYMYVRIFWLEAQAPELEHSPQTSMPQVKERIHRILQIRKHGTP